MTTKRSFSKRSKKNSFVIRLLAFQHNTWQGEITCLDTKEKQYFRSALELLRLIDSAVDDSLPTHALETPGELLDIEDFFSPSSPCAL